MNPESMETFLLFLGGLAVIGVAWIKLYLKVRSVELSIASLRENDLHGLADKLQSFGKQLEGFREELRGLREFIMETLRPRR